jgi:hypothetical protein
VRHNRRAENEQRMADIVNLRKARKAEARRRDEGRAAQNRLLHGRSKAERKREDKARREHEGHRIETEDGR